MLCLHSGLERLMGLEKGSGEWGLC
jgi:hypothetical protein